MMTSSPLVFKVRRNEPELIIPAKPTPHEFKPLSDIDDQGSLRFQVPFIQFYRNNVSMEGSDPVKVIRKAIADVLVFYYPFAGRIREGPGRKLIVDCTGEGVMFIEADADVTLDQFGSGDALLPSFPWLEQLLYEDPGFGGILHSPLLLIQVTRLLCGGFVCAIRLNHTIADGGGLIQFLNAVAEMAREGGAGASIPSIKPVWQRELFNARVPPRNTCIHRELDPLPRTKTKLAVASCHSHLDHRTFFFGKKEISSLRKHVPSHLRMSSRLEILFACIWRCRTIALSPHPKDEVRLILNINVRGKCHPPLPMGFYGNAFVSPVAFTTAEKLCQNPLGYALELVKKTKESVTNEYIRSFADLLVIRGRPELEMEMTQTYVVSDLTRTGFEDVNFGWGKAVYGGPAEGVLRPYPGMVSMFIRFKNDKCENGILVPVCLPGGRIMDKFEREVQRSMKENVIIERQHFATKL